MLCQWLKTGYSASMCLMSPPQRAPTVPLESAGERQCVYFSLCVCERERETAETKVPCGCVIMFVLGFVCE